MAASSSERMCGGEGCCGGIGAVCACSLRPKAAATSARLGSAMPAWIKASATLAWTKAATRFSAVTLAWAKASIRSSIAARALTIRFERHQRLAGALQETVWTSRPLGSTAAPMSSCLLANLPRCIAWILMAASSSVKQLQIGESSGSNGPADG
eukprot:CAMPEP_0115259378 /NCGR_PEP_ID=MMETSP0270-20121206/47793_1 /TAXON_ID=71861 /ORGANISM="Scrippsiella trochoidea, Strain CCMP3099" /LENGTH=153 /DNA_ID=CAMNT_0002675185 /DNA_START=74 /DNA_END=536 /DNA_ORIENTATION=+